MRESGVAAATRLRQLPGSHADADHEPTGLRVVFLCTGNRFRSPLAAAIFEEAAAQHGVPVAVESAGTLDVGSRPPFRETIKQAERLGYDISSHRSRPARDVDLSTADLLIGFERSHVAYAVVDAGVAAERAFTLPSSSSCSSSRMSRFATPIVPPGYAWPSSRQAPAALPSAVLRAVQISVRLPQCLGAVHAAEIREFVDRPVRELARSSFDLSAGRDHVADGVAPGEQHRQPVDPQAEAPGRRHAVGQRLHVVGIAADALDVLRLLVEAQLLLVRVSDLRVGVAQLHARGEVLEALGQRGVVVLRPRERRQLDGVAVDDRGRHERRLHEVAEGVVDELGPVLVRRRVDARSSSQARSSSASASRAPGARATPRTAAAPTAPSGRSHAP